MEEVKKIVQNVGKNVMDVLREMGQNILKNRMEFQNYQERMNKAMQD